MEKKLCKSEDLPDRILNSNKSNLHTEHSIDEQGNFKHLGIDTYCVGDTGDAMELYGNFDTTLGATLNIMFDICREGASEVKCQSPEQIYKKLQGVYIFVIMSKKAFITHEFSEDSVPETYDIQWFPITLDQKT